MHLTSFLQNDKLTVVLTGEIDHHCAKQYIQAIGAKIEAYNPARCILDFQEVTFMDSSGIAVAINALRAMSRIGGHITVSGLGNQPLKVFRTAGIDKLISIEEETV